MAKIKKHDFVEIEYTGRTKDDNAVFDTTYKEIAKKEGIYNEDSTYGPMIVCVGEGQVIKGMDNYLEKAEAPSEATLEIIPEEGFGRKDSKLVRMIPAKKFAEQNIMAAPGLQVNIDGLIGAIKTVGGGRVLVDFNHPLASQQLNYSLKVKRIISEDSKKVESYLKIFFGHDISVEENEGTITAATHYDIPEEVATQVKEKIRKIIPTVKEIIFTKKNK